MTILALYTDGGVIGRNPSPDGGTWAFCHVDEAGQRVHEESGIIYPGGFAIQAITNNQSELIALINGMLALPRGWSGVVASDSAISLGRLFWSWKWHNVPLVMRAKAQAALEHIDAANSTPLLLDGHPTKAQLVAGIGKRGHPVSEHNVWCDVACGQQAQKYREDLYANLPF